jgi:hypothetical protein
MANFELDYDPCDFFDEMVGGMIESMDCDRADVLKVIFAGRTLDEVCAEYNLPADFFDGDDDVPFTS